MLLEQTVHTLNYILYFQQITKDRTWLVSISLQLLPTENLLQQLLAVSQLGKFLPGLYYIRNYIW